MYDSDHSGSIDHLELRAMLLNFNIQAPAPCDAL